MSKGGESEAVDDDTCCCAACGIAEIDDIKLVPCDDCDLVRYCGDTCQRDHKSEHEEACRKRAAELHDELLFKQPENSCLGDCPICMLPLLLDPMKSRIMTCCSKVICGGCYYANRMREKDMRLVPSCPFCREPTPRTDEEIRKQRMRRIEANDPLAMCQQGLKHCNKKDYHRAFEYFTKAAKLGYAWAHYQLSCLYHNGEGAERDEGKRIHHWEEAAIGGHPLARFNLGVHEHEWKNGSKERAVKHWMISAAQGDDKSIKELMEMFKGGELSKDDLTSALRAYQAAVEATKSPQREAAEKTRGSIF